MKLVKSIRLFIQDRTLGIFSPTFALPWLPSFLEHTLISPSGTALLLGSEDGQEIVDLEMRNPKMEGLA